MFFVAPNPILATIGPISIRYYGLVYALGFLFVYWWLNKEVTKQRCKLNRDQVDIYMILVILGGVLGGRLGEFLFFEPNVLVSNPAEILKIWHGGMSIHGGIIGFVLVTYFFAKKHNIHFYDLSDKIVIPASLVLVFGRIANFINGELLGTVTTLPWAVNWFGEKTTSGTFVGRHPSTIYESIKNFAVFLTLFFIDKKVKKTKNDESEETKKRRTNKKTKNKKEQEEKTITAKIEGKKTTKIVMEKSYLKSYLKKGYLTWMFLLLFNGLRAITDIWRDDGHWLFGIFSTGQLLSIIIALLSIIILIKWYWMKEK